MFGLQVDHFSFANQDTFQQRYLVNDDHWDINGGPIFFYCGNEGDIELFSNNTVGFLKFNNLLNNIYIDTGRLNVFFFFKLYAKISEQKTHLFDILNLRCTYINQYLQ